MNHKKIITMCVCGFFMMSCTHDNVQELKRKESEKKLTTECDTAGVISFSKHIIPILTSECGSELSACHSTSGNMGSCILDTYEGVLKEVKNGRLLGSIRWESGYEPMPLGALAKIDRCKILRIEKWISENAPYN